MPGLQHADPRRLIDPTGERHNEIGVRWTPHGGADLGDRFVRASASTATVLTVSSFPWLGPIVAVVTLDEFDRVEALTGGAEEVLRGTSSE